MLSKIKNLFPESLKGPIKSALQSSRDIELEKYAEKKKIIVTVAGFYQNLGDMALTYSQKEFLKNNFSDYEVILLSSRDTYVKMKALKKICTEEDIITTIGGGNMDDIYTSLEDVRRFIVKSFPNNRIISFPQTIAFSDTPYGQKRLKKSARTYSKHKNLTIFAREPKSLEIMKRAFPKNKIGYCPDIVLSLNKVENKTVRDGVVYCVRNDLEAFLTEKQREILKKIVSENFNDVIYTDTVNVTLEGCSPQNYEKTLEDFWSQLRRTKVVVTDRLHCMIFCAITKTPCVVLTNSNHKIKGTFNQWLKDLGYIKYIDGFDEKKIIESMKELEKINLTGFKELDMAEKYGSLVQAISG